jgi:hypothetical protein
MASPTREQLVVFAYARLKGLRENINPTPQQPFVSDVLWQDFNKAIDDLKAAGYELSRFAITGSDMDEGFGGHRHVRFDVLRSRVDALLVYFTVETGQAPRPRVGFEAPPTSTP